MPMYQQATLVEQVPAAQWESWRNEHGAVVLDVREPMEWAMGTLPGSDLMAMSTISTDWQKLDPHTPLLVVCRTGSRSNVVAQALQNAGFGRVANLAGGLAALGLA
jgi:rhodanese-related sulfurtransferase